MSSVKTVARVIVCLAIGGIWLVGAAVCALLVVTIDGPASGAPDYERFTADGSDGAYVVRLSRTDASSPAEITVFRGGPFVFNRLDVVLPEPVDPTFFRYPRVRVIDGAGQPVLEYETADGLARTRLNG